MNKFVLFFCMAIVSLSILSFSYANVLFVWKTEQNFERKIECENVLMNILNDFQMNVDESADFPHFDFMQAIFQKYSYLNIKIEDISSTKSLEEIQSFLDEEYCLELTPDFYGWIPSFLAKKFENSSSKINLSYPIVNNLPLLNIYFSDKRILQEILNFYKIDKKKQNEFFKQIDLCNILTKEDIKNVLDLSEKSKILLYLGTKTTFWKVEFEDEYFVCDAIFCAIPKKDETEKIEKYEILEANFEKKCSL